MPVAIVSGTLRNATDTEAVVFSHRIDAGEAPWVRVLFASAHLPAGSFLRLVAEEDGAVQTFSGAELAEWGNSSAYFNGHALRVELVAGPRTNGNAVTVHIVIAGTGTESGLAVAPSPEAVCGNDARTRSNNPATARLLSSTTGPKIRVCSGFIIDTAPDYDPMNRCLLSAGHCFDDSLTNPPTIAQFRVPDSNLDCTMKQVDPADQFPVVVSAKRNLGIGSEDWAVLTLGRSRGKTAWERQQAQFRLTEPEVAAARKFGFGAAGVTVACTCNPNENNNPANIRNFTQLKADGAITEITTQQTGGILVRHTIDTCGGDSGGPIVKSTDSTAAVAIQTESRCNATTPNVNDNRGTSVTSPALVTAIGRFKNNIWSWKLAPMIDYDQKQNAWGAPCPNNLVYTWCGPVSLANAITWLDAYVLNGLVPIPWRTPAQAGAPVDAVKLIEGIAPSANDAGTPGATPGCGGVDQQQMMQMAIAFFAAQAPGKFDIHPIPADEFGTILAQTLNPGEVVIALLGFHQFVMGNLERQGGHWVVLSGGGFLATGQRVLAISDPYWDNNAVGEGAGRFAGPHGDPRGAPAGGSAFHNTIGNFSHDVFKIADAAPPLRLEDYGVDLQTPFAGQNPGPLGFGVVAPGTYIECVLGVQRKPDGDRRAPRHPPELDVVTDPAGSEPITVRYLLDARSDVDVSIYDVAGRFVRALERGLRDQGWHVVQWDRRDDGGMRVTRGIYLVQLQAGAESAGRKIVLLHK